MNKELRRLVRLYEAMHTCDEGEDGRTLAALELERVVRAAADRHKQPFNLLMRWVKHLYHEQARADERRRRKPPPPRDE